MNKRKPFNPNMGQLLVTGHDAEAVFCWNGFRDPDHLVDALSVIREYVRNSCTGVFISGESLCQPLPRPVDTEVEDFAAHRAREGNLDLRTSAAMAKKLSA